MGRSGGRPLHETPDHFVKAKLTHCEACGDVIPKRLQQLLQRYDKIDSPPITPVVTRVERYGCVCSGCGSSQLAAVPTALAPGSPFSRRIQGLVTALRYGHVP